MSKDGLSSKIKKELADMPEPFTVLILTQPSIHFATYLDLLDFAINEQKMEGVCLTITRPASSLKAILEKKGVSSEKLFFIDCISKIAGAAEPCDKCTFVSHPSNLTDISIALNNAVRETSGKNKKKFLIVDSWSSLLIYNDQRKVLGFSNFIINKLRAQSINSFMVTMREKSYEEFADSMSAFCDKVISI
jgi:hypothetical protein